MDLEHERTVFRRLVEVLDLPPEQREDAVRRTRGLDQTGVEQLLELVRRDASEPDSPVSDAQLVRPLEPGLRLGDFRLVRKLGEGGMGQVWEAEQLSLNRRVALKLLRSGLLDDSKAVESLRHEAETAASLAHPGIITVYSVGEAEGLPYIAQELVADGLDLRQWIAARSGSAPPSDHVATVARLMADVADAVQAAHAAGIVHRDIKPHNLMLRADGRPVVLDFGLAGLTVSGPGDLTRRLVGTAAYLAPEQLRDQAVGKDPRTDVYQLGATLYELLTLRRAFSDGDMASLERRILAGDFPRPRKLAPGLPYALEAICLRAMALQPAARYADAGALRDDLRRFVGGHELPHAARGGPLLGALRRVPYLLRRHRLVAAASAAIVLGALAGVLIFGGDEAGPSVRALSRTADGATLVAWEDSDVARPGDMLGVALELTRPSTVYALSAFGERSPPTWVMPVDPKDRAALLAEGKMPERARNAPWGLPLPAGRHELMLSQLGESSLNVAHEGFILLVADDASPVLEAWFGELERAASASRSAKEVGQTGARYKQACELFDGLFAGRRGEALRMSAEQVAGLASVAAEDVLGQERFEVEGVQCWRVMWRVER